MIPIRKRNNGFTLIEVAIAVVIIGLALTVLLQTQTQLITTSGRAYERFTQATRIWNTCVYAQRQEWYQKEQEQAENFYSDDTIQYQYDKVPIAQQSDLAEYTQHGVLERITATEGDQDKASLVMYRYAPQQDEEQ